MCGRKDVDILSAGFGGGNGFDRKRSTGEKEEGGGGGGLCEKTSTAHAPEEGKYGGGTPAPPPDAPPPPAPPPSPGGCSVARFHTVTAAASRWRGSAAAARDASRGPALRERGSRLQSCYYCPASLLPPPLAEGTRMRGFNSLPWHQNQVQ